MRNQRAYGLADVQLGENNEWNELHFVSRDTFAHMAPSVLTLEIKRIGGLIDRLPLHDEHRNALVSARHRLRLLRDMVTGDFGRADLTACEQHLNQAILAVGLRGSGPRSELDPTLDNIADRLGFVRERLRRLR